MKNSIQPPVYLSSSIDDHCEYPETKIKRLEVENLKLKELVRDFSKVLYNGEFYPNFKDAELFESILNRIELVVNR